MPQHDHEADLDRVRRQAHEQGREQGRAEVLPFAGAAGVSFPTDLPTHEAVVSYEQLLMEAQPHLHERVSAVQEAIDRLFEEHHQADVDLKSVHLRDTSRSPRAWLRRLLATRALEQRVDDMETLEHLRDDVARESLLALVDAVGATDWQRVLAHAGRG